jgi:hypothetical protein
LRSLFSFIEVRKFFISTDDRNPFCILALEPIAKAIQFSFQVPNIGALRHAERRFSLTPAEIATINPNTQTAPIFRSRADADLTRAIYGTMPVLMNDALGTALGQHGNPWNLEFQAMFHMSGDSDQFRTAQQLAASGYQPEGRNWQSRTGERYVPLMEAKMVHHYDHRWATYAGTDAEDVTVTDKANPDFEVTPRYWIPEADVVNRLASKGWTRGWLMGWRDICRSTDERTVIASAFPLAGCGDKILLMYPAVSERLRAALLATMISLPFDFVARQKQGGTSLKYYTMKQLVAPPPTAFSAADLDFIVPRVIELSYTSNSMRPFAEDLAYSGPPFGWDEDRRARLRAELDARIARLYRLTRNQLRYILDPEDAMGKGYPSETFRALRQKEIAKYDDYRTARLVLAAWDRDQAGE